jgi:3' exoribonuclease, RNase T-like
MKNLMIDIETLATRPDAIILSIAAVKFEFGSDKIEQFSINIDPKSCKQHGMVSDPATIAWWKEQKPEAIAAFMKNPVTIDHALDKLSEFVGPDWKDIVFWCNGMNFDYPVLEWSYKALNKPVPWRYWNLRDARTVYAVFDIDMRYIERVGVYHNSIDDCLTQIKALKQALS